MKWRFGNGAYANDLSGYDFDDEEPYPKDEDEENGGV